MNIENVINERLPRRHKLEFVLTSCYRRDGNKILQFIIFPLSDFVLIYPIISSAFVNTFQLFHETFQLKFQPVFAECRFLPSVEDTFFGCHLRRFFKGQLREKGRRKFALNRKPFKRNFMNEKEE